MTLIRIKSDSHSVLNSRHFQTRESSSASLISTNSVRSDVTDDGDDTPCGLSRDRPASRKHRLQVHFVHFFSHFSHFRQHSKQESAK